MFTKQSSSFYKNILSISTFGTNGLIMQEISNALGKLQTVTLFRPIRSLVQLVIDKKLEAFNKE